MDVAALRRVLLELFGTVRVPELSDLTTADWAWIDQIAASRRLQPLLHVQHRDTQGVPPEIAEAWRSAYREAAMLSLTRDAELRECLSLLEAEGWAPIALKGAWLARHAYPEAAQRPMFDIDLLLDQDTVLPAWKRLKAAGFTEIIPAELALEDVVRIEKHMPPLLGPRGNVIELHQRLWERDGRLDHAMPAPTEDAIRGRIVNIDAIRFPAPPDMLVHLIIHAAYSHRLDCGPRVLADIDFLLRREPIDWAQFWDRAATEGWRNGARLVLELTQRFRAGVKIDFAPDRGDPVPIAVLDGAADLLLLDPERRSSAGFAASVIKTGVRGLIARAVGTRKIEGEAPAPRAMDDEGGRWLWARSRLARTAGDLANADTRRQAAELARLSRWFDR